MQHHTRHIIRWFLGITTILLCSVVCRVDVIAADRASEQTAEAVNALYEEYEATCASLCEKKDDMLHAARKMGKWAVPSTSITLQGAEGRVVTLNTTLQRTVRMFGALLTSEAPCSTRLTKALRHTILTKRFYAGYYIYYRCQMRC